MLYWFNPDNDLALGDGGAHYTSPPWARQLQHDLQLLPCWVAQQGDGVLVDEVTPEMQKWVMERCPGVTLVSPTMLATMEGVSYRPWGWSTTARWRLLKMGARAEDLPSIEEMERLRVLSHRRTSTAVSAAIETLTGNRQPQDVGVELSTVDEVMAFAAAHPGCYIKAPWSGSGRGIYHVTTTGDPHLRGWVAGLLNRQGSLVCERGLPRVMDMAVEYWCEGGKASVTGHSLFLTDRHSQYAGGIVDSDAALRERINSIIDGKIEEIERIVATALEQIVAPHYNGPVGVDMLAYRDGSATRVRPCVEVNLRTTMGMVCAALGTRHHLRGTFTVGSLPHSTPSTPLVPPGDCYTAYISVES